MGKPPGRLTGAAGLASGMLDPQPAKWAARCKKAAHWRAAFFEQTVFSAALHHHHCL